VVLIHGGFWRQEYDRRHLRPLAAACARLGLAVLLPEYRRVGGTGGWPATFDDVRTVLGHLPQLSVPPAEVVVAGHSAGGHLALWAAAAAPPPTLVGVVGLAAVADLTSAARRAVGEGAAVDLMGAAPDEAPNRYRAADPAGLPTPTVPVTLVHDQADTLVPFWLAERYVLAHPSTSLVRVPGGHFGLIDPGSRAWPAVAAAVTG
jgi:acetyl esterase/lipase